MKKLVSLLTALCLVLALTAGGAMGEGGKQTASAVLDPDAEAVITTVDLSGGWSIEFSLGAFYLYDGAAADGIMPDAIGLTLEQDVYEEYMAAARESDTCREIEGGLCYEEDESTYYILAVGSSAYFLLDVLDRADGDAILERIELVNERDLYADLAEDVEPAEDDPAAAYLGNWIAGRALLTIEEQDDAIHCTVNWGNSASESTVWEYDCQYDEVTGGLTSLETGVKSIVTYGEGGEITDTEVLFEDGAANFDLDGEGGLVWTDFKETPGENEVLFEKAAEPEDEGLEISTLFEDGSFIIQIPDPEGDLNWLADDMSQDDSVVKLYDADLIEDTFVVRYDPVGDGDVTVGVRHYTGIACDQAFTWDLRVADGAVQEVTGGSHTASPDEAEQDPLLSGEWLTYETQFESMTITKGEERGWDVEIVSPMTHGAYIFKTTIYYDCELDGFVYDKGKYWDVPITDSDEEVDLGEARVAGTTGIFSFEFVDGGLLLGWYDDQRPEESVLFERVDVEE